MERRVIAYWFTTGIFCLVLVFSGVTHLLHLEFMVENMNQLGYPVYVMTILGCYAHANEDETSVRDRLTTTSMAGRPGQRVDGSRLDYVGPDTTTHLVGRSQHWLLPDPVAGGWVWERWTYLHLGSRHFLLRAVARGVDRQGARQHFRAQEPWFATIAQSLTVR